MTKNLRLEAFILSVTPPEDLINNTLTEAELEARHILFMHDKTSRSYLQKLFMELEQNKSGA
jgi:hypothetical protein